MIKIRSEIILMILGGASIVGAAMFTNINVVVALLHIFAGYSFGLGLGVYSQKKGVW